MERIGTLSEWPVAEFIEIILLLFAFVRITAGGKIRAVFRTDPLRKNAAVSIRTNRIGIVRPMTDDSDISGFTIVRQPADAAVLPAVADRSVLAPIRFFDRYAVPIDPA